ncbi:gaf domain-containing protein [Candidatus Halobonum tyrrellensis G22]|uniref:Gaf domain-containing protein n=1 Tax=Candidatus Halobonum tyrrellensis G22 TaxID=1324957 RepID=V4J0I1_9EURY|nr:gaf domain-containing protein [Candidatus Halobonum tyrrellensis G22]
MLVTAASESDGDADDAGGAPTPEAVHRVADDIGAALGADTVVKHGITAREYVAELAPLLDCVVCLADDTDALASFADLDPQLPLVAYGEATSVSPVSSVVRPDDGIDALVARVADRIERNRERNRLDEANTKLTALNTYTRAITACESREEVVDRVVGAVTEALAYDRCVLAFVEGGELVPYGNLLPDEEAVRLDVGEGVAGRTYVTGESMVVDDYDSHPAHHRESPYITSVASVAVGEYGVLQVTTPDEAAFDERDVEFLEIVAAHAAEALARLERETALRSERDRLYAFFERLPAPTVYVESACGEPPVVREANAAYERSFPDAPVGVPVDEAFPTDVERRLFGESIRADDPVSATVRRPTADAADAELTVTLVPVRTTGVEAAGFGVYVDEVALP